MKVKNMNKEFIPYQQALQLKELGFDERTLTLWHKDKTEELITLPHKGILYGYSNSLDAPWLTAPTFSQAFRWFREKHNLYSEILVDRTMEPKFVFTIHTHLPEFNWGDKHLSEYLYRTYEEAEQTCLEKLIEIVKNKQD